MARSRASKQRWQITIYVSERDDAAFRLYALSLGLDASSLLVLLLLRAGRVGFGEQQVREVARRATSGPAKITAHFATEDVYARAASVLKDASGDPNQSRVGRVLIRLELEERWLGRELGIDSH